MGSVKVINGIVRPEEADRKTKKMLADFCESQRKKEQYALGFIPACAYDQAIDRGRLYVSYRDAEPSGYMFWAKRKGVIRIHQACVDEEWRRDRNATQLLAEILGTRLGKSARKLYLRVASDLPANKFWQAIGCEIKRTAPGGKTWDRVLNCYEMDLRNKMAVAQGMINGALSEMGTVVDTAKYAD